MGTVHSLQEAAAASPERLRRRFDLALAELNPRKESGHQLSPQFSVSGDISFEAPWETAGRIADDVMRQTTLFWFSVARQQACFFGFIP